MNSDITPAHGGNSPPITAANGSNKKEVKAR
jgi:hypothetical protein